MYSTWGFAGDFGLYIIGTNSGFSRWFAQRRQVFGTLTAKQQYENYLSSLTQMQRDLVEALRKARQKARDNPRLETNEAKEGRKELQLSLSRRQFGFFEELAEPPNCEPASQGAASKRIYTSRPCSERSQRGCPAGA